jgi:hypothetical protein
MMSLETILFVQKQDELVKYGLSDSKDCCRRLYLCNIDVILLYIISSF